MPSFALAAPAPRSRAAHPHVQLVGEAGTHIVIPLAAPLELTDLAARFTETERVGDVDMIGKTSRPIPKVTTTLQIVGRNFFGAIDPWVSVEAILQALRGVARTGERFELIGYGNSTGGQWVFTDMGMTDTRRRSPDNSITQANVAVTFKRVGDSKLFSGGITGGAVGGAGNSAMRVATVGAGGSLMQAAYAAYGNAQRWFDIADANDILDPHRLTSSTQLTIPRP